MNSIFKTLTIISILVANMQTTSSAAPYSCREWIEGPIGVPALVCGASMGLCAATTAVIFSEMMPPKVLFSALRDSENSQHNFAIGLTLTSIISAVITIRSGISLYKKIKREWFWVNLEELSLQA